MESFLFKSQYKASKCPGQLTDSTSPTMIACACVVCMFIYTNVPLRKIKNASSSIFICVHRIYQFLTKTFTDANTCILSIACCTTIISSSRNSSCITVHFIHHYFTCSKKMIFTY